MGRVTVEPAEFRMVLFDAARIGALATDALERVGLAPEVDVRIEVNEASPLGRTGIASLDPVVITADSGAFEDGRRPRNLNERGVADVVGRLLFRAKDRLTAGFGDPPPDDGLTLAQQSAWDTYCVGRCERAGLPVQKQRRLYHFRNRHGFTDVADEAFERLWTADGLTWADIEATCAVTAAAREPAPA